MLQAELKVISGKQEGAMIPLPLGKFLIGREEDCHLRPNSDLVSRHHCVFSTDEYSLRIRDLGSTNGTFVNGERLRGAVMLNSGDRVAVGKLEFEVAIKEVAGVVEPGAEETATDAFNMLESVAETEPETGSETLTEIPAVDADETHAGEETVMLQGGDTSESLPSTQPPPDQQQMAPPPGYGQMPMGYPPQYMQSPYGYPGYPMPPMPGYYPQQAMPYPPMQQPGYPMPPQQQPAPAQPEAPAPESSHDVETSDGIPIRLPDPSETGAKEPEPKPEKAEGGEKSGKESPSMTGTAEDIIKQYLHRRPKSS
ncbi:MAG: FHA domain-containing protein [Maioricimonas sp. JB049]